MPKLPRGSQATFATAIDAFRHDWKSRFNPVVALSTAGVQSAPVAPRPLASVVAFYVTRRQFTPDPKPWTSRTVDLIELPVRLLIFTLSLIWKR